MPWTLEGASSSEWAQSPPSALYVGAGYVLADYFEGEQWAQPADDDETWAAA